MNKPEAAYARRSVVFREIDKNTIEFNGKRIRAGKRSIDWQTENLRRKVEIEAAR